MKVISKSVLTFLGVLAVSSQSFAFIRFGQEVVDEGLKGCSDGPISCIQSIVISFLSLVSVIAVIFLIYSGFVILTARGNEDQVTKGKKILLYTLIGIIIIFLSWTIVSLTFDTLGGNNIS